MHSDFNEECDCKTCRRERQADELRRRIRKSLYELDLEELQTVFSVIVYASRDDGMEPDYTEEEVPF